MEKMRSINSDVYVTEEIYPSVGRSQMEFLRHGLAGTSRGRIRLCAHKRNEDSLHEMFIAFAGANYIRPSRHLGKDESLHMLDGVGDYFFFNEGGEVSDMVSLGTYESGYQFYCRIPAGQEHNLLIRSDDVAVHETTVGPFSRGDTVFSAWSPGEDNHVGMQHFMADQRGRVQSERHLLSMNRSGPEVFVADEHIVSVGKREIEFLKAVVPTTDRKRIRLCAHKDLENPLHEMFVIYTDMTYVKPNKHINKDESLHILEGEADFIFFDESGNIMEIIPLGDYNSKRQFYVRVPAFAWHTIVMRSKILVIHEVISGPFRREDTLWAPWAPTETDYGAVAHFLDRMRTAVATKT